MVTKRDPIEVAFPEAGSAHVRTRAGKRVEVKPGERLFITVDDAGRMEHAWVDDDVERRGRAIISSQEDLMNRIRPALEAFIAKAVEHEAKLDDGHCSTFKVQVGIVGYDAEDRPYFGVTVESKHSEEL